MTNKLFLPLFILQFMPATGADSTGVGENPPTEAPQVSTVVNVPFNIFTGTLQGILGFTITQVRVFVGNGYDSQESVIYWKIIDIKEWCQLKSNISTSHGGMSYGERKIKCLQALAWWLTDLALRGKIIDINNFKANILAGAIEEFRIDLKTQEMEKWS